MDLPFQYLEMMYGGPIPPMMLTWGVIFLFMAAGGKLIGMKATGWRRWAILVIGLIFLLVGLRVYIRPLPLNPPPVELSATPAVSATAEPGAASEGEETPTGG